MATITDIRAKFPQYRDLSDEQLADALYRKHYADMPREEFDKRVGLKKVGLAEGAGISAAQGAAFGFADEIAGNIAGAAKVAYDKGGLPGLAASAAANLVPGLPVANWAAGYMTDPEKFTAAQVPVTEKLRDLHARFRQERPWTAFGAEMLGTLPSLGLGGGLAAARTIPQAAMEGAKLGGMFGAASGAGYADGTLPDRAVGATEGLAWGVPLGALAGGGVKAIEGAVNTALPYLRQGAAAIRSPEQLAMRDVATAAARDNIDLNAVYRRMTPRPERATGNATPQNVVETIIDRHAAGMPVQDIAGEVGIPASTVQDWIERFQTRVAPEFQGQNLLETMVTPTEPGQVVVAPNVTATAKYAANTEGAGRARLMSAIRQRQADQADEIASQIDRYFGSGDFDAHVAAVKGETQRAAGDLYGALEDQPLLAIQTDARFARLRNDPLFERAMQYAERDAKLRGLPFPGGEVYTPRTINLVQQQLRRASDAMSDPNEAYLARMMRRELLDVADQHIEGFAGIRGFYRNRMAQEEALDIGRKLGVGAGASDAEGLQFFRKSLASAEEAQKAVKALEKASKGTKASNSRADELAKARVQAAQAQAIVDDFRRAFGQGLKDLLDRGKDANRYLGAMERRMAEARVREVLPPKQANRFLATLRSHLRRRDTAGRLYGGSDTQPKTQHQKRMDAVTDVGAGLVTLNPARVARGVGDLVSAKAREVRANRINDLMTDMDALAVRRRVDALRRLQEAAWQPGGVRLMPYAGGAVNALSRGGPR